MGENSIDSLSRVSLQRPLLEASLTRNDLENGWIGYFILKKSSDVQDWE